MPKSAADGQLVNIPALPYDYPLRDEGNKYLCLIGLAFFALSQTSVERRSGFYLADKSEEPSEKSAAFTSCEVPYRKPTLVDRASSPRGTSDSSLRNSAYKRP